MSSPLLPGDWVEIRSPEEIARTLDAGQSVAGLPFMPEMLAYCGGRYRVRLRAERLCVRPPESPFRQLQDTVILEGLRCDGSAHGWCQLGCMLLWKEGWLRRDGPGSTVDAVPATGDPPVLRVTRDGDPARFVCQATELRCATAPGQPVWRPGQYVRMLRIRTMTPREMARMLSAPVRRMALRVVRWKRPPLRAAGLTETSLGLQPGDLVEVRSSGEILATLDAHGQHHGLKFSPLMYGQCGRTLRVQGRVERVVDERTGRLRRVLDTVTLEGSVCDRRNGCARGMPMLWREAWLRRATAQGVRA